MSIPPDELNAHLYQMIEPHKKELTRHVWMAGAQEAVRYLGLSDQRYEVVEALDFMFEDWYSRERAKEARMYADQMQTATDFARDLKGHRTDDR